MIYEKDNNKEIIDLNLIHGQLDKLQDILDYYADLAMVDANK